MGISRTGTTCGGQKLMIDAILESKMATSGFRKTGKYCRIPTKIGISRIGTTCRGRKLMIDAILESKMATSGFWENWDILLNTYQYGYFQNGDDMWRPEIDD